MLGVVVNRDLGTEGPRAAVDGQDSGEDLQQRRLAGAVDADEGDPLATLHGQGEPPVDDVVAVRLVDVRQRDHRPARPRRGREGEADPTAGAVDDHPLDPLQHLDPALHLPRLRGLVPEALDEPLDLGDALGLVPSARREQLLPRLPLDQVPVVGARVEGEPRGRELRDRRHHPVQEVPVVRRDHDRPLVARQELLEPPERLEIQVVGRLVQQEQRGAQQQQTGEGGAHPPATRELSERARDLLPLEAEPAEDDPRLGFQPVAPAGLESVLELAVPRRERLRRVGRQRGAQLPEFALDRPHVVEPPERLREHGAGRGATDFLREVADRDAAVAAHVAAVRLLETGQEAAERRLADAVRSDQPDPLVGGETPGEVREEALAAVALRDGLELDHRARCPARARGGSRRSRGPRPPAGGGASS